METDNQAIDFHKEAHAFLQELKEFQYKFDGGDRIWKIIFFDRKDRWHTLYVQQYKETFYLSLVDGDAPNLEMQMNTKVGSIKSHRDFFDGRSGVDYNDTDKQWEPLISAARAWLKRVKRDWIKANALVVEKYPINRRKGYVPHSIVRASLSDIHRLDLELANQGYPKDQHVHDVIHYDDLGRYKRRIKPFITWDPLPVLIPK